MSIRNRTFEVNGINIAAASTVIIALGRIPSIPGNGARVRSIRAHVAAFTATGLTVGIYKSATNLADDSAANSTTLVHDAVITLNGFVDAPQADPLVAQYTVPKGVWLYAKFVQTGAGATTGASVIVELDY